MKRRTRDGGQIAATWTCREFIHSIRNLLVGMDGIEPLICRRLTQAGAPAAANAFDVRIFRKPAGARCRPTSFEVFFDEVALRGRAVVRLADDALRGLHS